MEIKHISSSLRRYRRWHRWVGISVGLLVVVSSLTGILLALKKDVSLIQPPTQKTTATTSTSWLSIESISKYAESGLRQHTELSDVTIDRMDVRLSKGIVKVIFEQDHWEVQVDGRSGEVLSVAKRHSDWIEQLHDGSIVSDAFKLISMHTLGLGLLVLTASGFWLWLGPRRIRKIKKRSKALKNKSKFV